MMRVKNRCIVRPDRVPSYSADVNILDGGADGANGDNLKQVRHFVGSGKRDDVL